MANLEMAIVRILNIYRKPVGAGFLVAEGRILTCAHVVEVALGRASEDRPTENFSLDFPLVATKQVVDARVIVWQKEDDIAGLELLSPVPKEAQPVRLVDAKEVSGHEFDVLGFPNGYDGGVWGNGLIRRLQGNQWIQIESVSQLTYTFQHGFSGGAVWDKELLGVVGMVMVADPKMDYRTAFMIPAKQLIAAWPELQATAIPPNPYRGLLAFREEHAPFFFGQDEYTNRLLEAVRRKSLVAQSLIAVIGPSGSGKSSVVFAGLVPRLRAERVDGGNWLVVDFRPGQSPFQALAAALIPHLEPNMTEVSRREEKNQLATVLQNDPSALTDFIHTIVQKTPGVSRLFLVIDQFEELYTLAPESEQVSFVDTLLHAVQSPAPTTILLTLRVDFMGHALLHRPFADALQEAAQMLGPMTREEVSEAICQPAQKSGVAFQDGLVARILDDVESETGSLPLLEFALAQLWERQTNGELTHEAYEAIGGVAGALARHASEEFDRLTEDEQARARRVLVQMVQPGEGLEDTRRVARREDLPPEDWAVARKLADLRLLVTDRDPTTEKETIEVAHEALIRGWGLLKSWMEEDRAFRTWQERLRAAMRQWEANNRDEGALLRVLPLEEAEDWLEKRGGDLSETEQVFIQASLNSRSWRSNRVLAISVGVAIVMTLLGIFGLNRSQLATQQAVTATYAQGQAQFQAATATALLGQLQQQSTAAAKFFAGQEAQLIANQGDLLFKESPLLGLQIILEGFSKFPTEILGLTQNPLENIFRSRAKEGRLFWVGRNIKQLIPITDGPYLVINYIDAPDELLNSDTGQLYLLTGKVDRVFPIANTSFIVVNYEDAPAELRKTDTDQVIYLKDKIYDVFAFPDSPFFIIAYWDIPGELWSKDLNKIITLNDLVTTIFPLIGTSLFIVDYYSKQDELRYTDSSIVVPLAGPVLNVYPFANTPFFVIDYDQASTGGPDELWRTDDINTIVPLYGDIISIYPIPDSPYFIVDYSNVPAKLLRTDSSEIIELSEWVEHNGIYPIPDSPFFVIDYDDILKKASDELRSTDNELIVPLSGEVVSVSYLANGSYFIVDYSDVLDELRKTDTGEVFSSLYSENVYTILNSPFFILDYTYATDELRHANMVDVIPLAGEFVSVFSIPGNPFFIINYYDFADAPSELRRNDTGEVVQQFNGDINTVVPVPGSSFFIVNYADGQSELWNGEVQILQLGLGVRDYFLSGENRLVVRYTDGRVYIIDLDWLTAMSGQAETMPLDELIDILCQGPLASKWVDEEALKAYLGGGEPQGCK